MDRISRITFAFRIVYERKIYYFLTIFISFVIFSFNLLIVNSALILKFPQPIFILNLIYGTFINLPLKSQIILTLISLLTGTLFSFLAFKIVQIRKFSKFSKGETTGILGTVIGILVPSCSSCGLGLLSVLGYSGILTIMPFKGLELGILAIILLTLSLIYLANKIVEGCNLKKD